MAITLNGTTGISSPGGDTSTSLATTNLSYTGTLTGGTGVIAIGTNQIYKDASGNVGIGTVSPGSKLHLTGSNVQFRMTNAAGTPTTRHIALVDSDNTWRFTRTGVADDLTIDNSGNVGIGTASPADKLDVLFTAVTPGNNSLTGIVVGPNSGSTAVGDGAGIGFRIRNTAGGSVGGNTLGSAIYGIQTNSAANTGGIAFYTRADVTTFSERARIDSSGNLLVGTTNPASSAFPVTVFSSTNGGIAFQNPANWTGIAQNSNDFYFDVGRGGTAGALYFRRSSSNTASMSISNAGVVLVNNLAGSGSRAVNADASGNLSAASDSSLKQEDKAAPIPGLTEILKITPRAYKWLADIENRGDEAVTEIGFFADEVAPIIPSAAPKCADGLYGFYDRSVTAGLVKAIQELTTRLEALEAQ